ncbi:uncharacterized protein [Nyctibius grandis]|uniref:uncharacterized protein isoform X2 n=1 Tax=Nyctibius grandis TaxID=48427 RepID=UPI0035BC1B02
MGYGLPTSRPDLVQEPQDDPTDVAPAPGPQMDPAQLRIWHRMGRQRAKYKDKLEKSWQRSSEVLKELLKLLDQAAHGTDPETVEKEALEEGDSHAVPVPLEEGDSHAVPVPDEERGSNQSPGVPGVDGNWKSNAVDLKDSQKYLIGVIVAVSGFVVLMIVLCFAICVCRKRKQCPSVEDGPDTSSRPPRPSTLESQVQSQPPGPEPGEPGCQPGSTGGPATGDQPPPAQTAAQPARHHPSSHGWVSADREPGMGPADRKNEGLDQEKEASSSRVKALETKNEALRPKRGILDMKIRFWTVQRRHGTKK